MYSSYCFSPCRSKSDLGLCTSCFCVMTALCSTACSMHVHAMWGERVFCGKSWESPCTRHVAKQCVILSRASTGPQTAVSVLWVSQEMFWYSAAGQNLQRVFCERIFLRFPWKKVFASRYFAHPRLSNRPVSQSSILGNALSYGRRTKKTPFTWPQLKKMGIYVHIFSITKLLEVSHVKQAMSIPTSVPYPTCELLITTE